MKQNVLTTVDLTPIQKMEDEIKHLKDVRCAYKKRNEELEKQLNESIKLLKQFRSNTIFMVRAYTTTHLSQITEGYNSGELTEEDKDEAIKKHKKYIKQCRIKLGLKL